MTCQAIAERGWTCPKMKECGCKAPAVMCYKALDGDVLSQMAATLPVTGDELKDLKTASDFIKKYLFNVEPMLVKPIINNQLRKRFSFKTEALNDAKAMHRKLYKEYEDYIKSQKADENIGLPNWYALSNRGLRFMPGVLASHMAENNDFIVISGTLFGYASGVYHEMAEAEAQRLVQNKLFETEAKMSQILDAQRQWMLQIRKDATEVNPNPFIINLRNGLYNVLEDTLEPHSPKYISTMQLPVAYSPGAECPRFRQYLKEVLPEHQIPLIQEMLGYFLVPVTNAQKCFVVRRRRGG